ncbi:MAG: uroporphyrinogen-III synthase [Chlorobi bacterium]|nr:uroporphyrinogen-III synthase [Chlorobiota bacterium]
MNRRKTFLLTTPELKQAPLRKLLLQEGFEVISLPMTEIEEKIPPHIIIELRDLRKAYQVVVLFSTPAAFIFDKYFKKFSRVDDYPIILTIGDSIARTMKGLGWKKVRSISLTKLEDLVKLKRFSVRKRRALILAPGGMIPDLRKKIKEYELRASLWDSYDITLPAYDRNTFISTLEREPDGIVFTSSAAVQNFVNHIEKYNYELPPHTQIYIAGTGALKWAQELELPYNHYIDHCDFVSIYEYIKSQA